MSKLLAALIAVGFSVGLNGAIAQNVESDKDKAQGQEKVMKEKEQGTSGAGQTGQSDHQTGVKDGADETKKVEGKPDQNQADQSTGQTESTDKTKKVQGKPDQNDAERAKPDATGADTGKADTDKKKYDK